MKRDKDLVRSILLQMEGSEKPRSGITALSQGESKESVEYHLTILEDAGFVERKIVRPFEHGVALDMGWRITWAGHEFLDTVRDPEIWRKTKNGADQLGSWTIKILADMASGYVRAKAQELGLPLA